MPPLMEMIGSVVNGDNPVVVVKTDGDFDPPTEVPWQSRLSDQGVRQKLRGAAGSVGRLKITYIKNSRPVIEHGTGFVVGDGLILTNRHVVDPLFKGPGMNFEKLDDSSGWFSFEPDGEAFAEKWPIEKAVFISSKLDIALIRIDKAATSDRSKLQFAEMQGGRFSGEVAAIGYPAVLEHAGLAGPEASVFGSSSITPTKRISPAVFTDTGEAPSFDCRHSCSTLPGSSGSPLIDLATGTVVAIHYFGDGRGGNSNWAISAAGIGEFNKECNEWLRQAQSPEVVIGATMIEANAAPVQVRDNFGVLPDPPDFRDLLYRPGLADLKHSKILKESLPPRILNQKDSTGCTGFALAHLMAILGKAEKGDAFISSRMAYEMARLHDEIPGRSSTGATLRGVIKGFYHNGLCLEPREKGASEWDGHWELTRELADEARSTSLGAYYRLAPVISDYHAAISEVGAILASAYVHDGWIEPREIEKPPKSRRIEYSKDMAWEPRCAHAFVIVGYDEKGFIVLNSAGEDWSEWQGVAGRARWSYEDWADNIIDGWVLRPGVRAPDAFGRTARSLFKTITEPNETSPYFAPRRRDLLGHVVLSDNGQLVDYGRFASNTSAIQQTVCYLDQQTSDGKRKYEHLLLFAHAETTDEEAAQRWVMATKSFFKDNGIYPVSILCDPEHAAAFSALITGTHAEAKRRLPELSPSFPHLFLKMLGRFGGKLWDSYDNSAASMFTDDANSGQALLTLIDGALKAGLKLHFASHLGGVAVLRQILKRLAAKDREKTDIASIQLIAPLIEKKAHRSELVALLDNNKKGKVRCNSLVEFVFDRMNKEADSSLVDCKSWIELAESCRMPDSGFMMGLQHPAHTFNYHAKRAVKPASNFMAANIDQRASCAEPRLLNDLALNIVASTSGQKVPVLRKKLSDQSLRGLGFIRRSQS